MVKKVLVVDDSVFIWEEMKRILNGSEFEIVAYAKMGEEALELYQKVTPDLVTMDIILPGMDGLETTRLLLEHDPDATVVMVSSLAYDETMEESRSLGAKGFLFKPFEPAEVLATMRRVTGAEEAETKVDMCLT